MARHFDRNTAFARGARNRISFQITRHTGEPSRLFEQTFKNIDDVLWKEAGCTTELDYTEQTSWMLFLRYLDDLEHERATENELRGARTPSPSTRRTAGRVGRRRRNRTAASTTTTR